MGARRKPRQSEKRTKLPHTMLTLFPPYHQSRLAPVVNQELKACSKGYETPPHGSCYPPSAVRRVNETCLREPSLGINDVSSLSFAKGEAA